MPTLNSNILVLAVCWLLATAGGVYMTFFHQPEHLETLKAEEQRIRGLLAQVSSLEEEEDNLRLMTAEAQRNWQANYKSIPDQMTSSSLVGTLNDLTQRGFDRFDVRVTGMQPAADHSYYTVNITGQGYFSSLYRFIWDIENNEHLYRIRDLNLGYTSVSKTNEETGAERMLIMVNFTMGLDAYFGASGSSAAVLTTEEGFERVRVSELPSNVLPTRQPKLNPFFPLVMSELPPNTNNLIDLDQAQLVGITGNEAMFLYQDEFQTVSMDAPVYLGRIIEIDPVKHRVVARLNKGGIIDEVELNLHTGERYRQAIGTMQLAPLEGSE